MSWPLRYCWSTSALRESCATRASLSLGLTVKPIPMTYCPLNTVPELTAKRCGLPVTRDSGSNDGVIPETFMPSESRSALPLTKARLVHTAQYSKTADLDGQGRLFMDF